VGIPGWFVAVFFLVLLLGVASTIWRISVARKLAQNAGLDPDTAAAVTLLSENGVDAAFLASALRPQASAQQSEVSAPVKSTEERLNELQALKDKGLVTDAEYDERREILRSI
jgi:hypothetical protein